MRDWSELRRDNSVKRKETSRQEISNKMDGARISAEDASISAQSLYGQFKDLYDSALMWCEIVLRAEGWVTLGGGHHEAAIAGFLFFVGQDVELLASLLNDCRRIRHNLRYDWEPDAISSIQVVELADAVSLLDEIIIKWLADRHPDLVPD
ncbi:MAG: hypothetical protein NTY09_07350 [bacterium]|nr:hypothetical protein [bacterium]